MISFSFPKFIALGIAVYLLSFATYADTSSAASNQAKENSAMSTPGVHLDQSKDIFFDQFNPYSYSLQLIQAKNTFNNHDLIIGGSLQIDWQRWHGNTMTTEPTSVYKNGKGLYLTQATLDFMGNVTPWLTEMLSIADAYIGQPHPEGNFLFLNRAFLMLGNLDKSPFYATFGINAIPFGVFTGTGVWDVPLTASYFYPYQAPLISVAYYKNGLNINVAEFCDEIDHRNHSVLNIYYNKQIGNFNYSLGVGYLTKLQVNAAGNPRSSKRRHAIPSELDLGNITDLNGSIGYGSFIISGEYNQGSQHVGANTEIPQAMNIKITYTKNIADRDTTFAVSRSQTFHLENVPTSLVGQDGVPLSLDGFRGAWAASVSRSFFLKNISLGIDFEKSETYSSTASYTGTLELYLYL